MCKSLKDTRVKTIQGYKGWFISFHEEVEWEDYIVTCGFFSLKFWWEFCSSGFVPRMIWSADWWDAFYDCPYVVMMKERISIHSIACVEKALVGGWMVAWWVSGWMGGWMMRRWMDGWMVSNWMDDGMVGRYVDGWLVGRWMDDDWWVSGWMMTGWWVGGCLSVWRACGLLCCCWGGRDGGIEEDFGEKQKVVGFEEEEGEEEVELRSI